MTNYGLLTSAPLFALLAWAAVSDCAARRIPNWLTYTLILGGLCHSFTAGTGVGPLGSLLGMTVGLALTFVFFAVGAMGGGDVKLLTALSLWIAPLPFLNLLIMMALLGGVLTIVFGAWHVMRRQRDKLAIPYGVAISMAGLWVLGTNYLPSSAVAGGLG